MAVTYNTILREIALAVNALTGASPTALQATYATVPLTAANFQSSIFPFLGLIDKMLDGQTQVINDIASTANHPNRATLLGPTPALAYGAEVTVDATGDPVIGVWGDVRDSATGQPCVKAELRQIQDRVVNPGGMWMIPVYWYARSDQRVYHTVSSVVIDVVGYQRPTADGLNLTTPILLLDDSVPAIIHAALTQCIRDDEFMAQGARFGELFERWSAGVKQGWGWVDSTTQVIEGAQERAA